VYADERASEVRKETGREKKAGGEGRGGERECVKKFAVHVLNLRRLYD
jgi:hypothetical protein